MKTIKELNELARTTGDIPYLAVILEDEIQARQRVIDKMKGEIDALLPIMKKLATGMEGTQLLQTLTLD